MPSIQIQFRAGYDTILKIPKISETIMALRNTLIIKLGALGDVLRTTPLLRCCKGPVTWITEPEAFPLLAGNPRIQRLLPITAAATVRRHAFDILVNFDEDERACRLAAETRARRKVGARLQDGFKTYCPASAPWFDMSLISRLGPARADRLKTRGRRCYQHYLFQACGLQFRGEEYLLPLNPAAISRSIVALETRVGDKWPAKAWSRFPELSCALQHEGFSVTMLRQKSTLAQYLADINRCGLLVAGDTLAMHVGLALRKAVVALFNCTSPHEIYGYGRMAKISHERLHDFFYRKDAAAEIAGGISAARVMRAVHRLSGRDISLRMT